MPQFRVIDYDIIYLSYDEPNAEENYADLLTKVPWAKRVHGVEGSDAAHKACAELSETDRFITIDGDNRIDEKFLNQVINFKPGVDLTRHVISWTGDNAINSLRYGNGGIKCWHKDTVLRMRTHENADPDNAQAQVDFCWDLEYIQIDDCMSTVYNNATPQQAWRAGFREGVKMALIEGVKPNKKELIGSHWKNLERLYVWTTVGADVENGIWAIYGAREGLYKTMCTDWDYINVRDFEYLNNMWEKNYSKIAEDKLPYEIMGLGETLRFELDVPIPVDPFSAQQSEFYKMTYKNPPRPAHPYVTSEYIPDPVVKKNDYDIVMISYNEPNANENYDNLVERFPRAKRIHGVKGIHQAHIAAANICETEMFWIVDGDAVIDNDFHFDYVAEDNRAVHVWRSQNPVNDLVYGYGGIKLFPTQMTRNMDTSKADMTTSISDRFKKMEQMSCVTAFNTGPFETWKSAFRECAKLSAKVIDRQKTEETDERLKTWTTVGHDRPYGEYALAGAAAGMEFGLSNGDDLKLINDFDWLTDQFNSAYPQENVEKAKINPQENVEPVSIIQSTNKNTLELAPRDEFIVDLLDRFEILYGDKITNLRRFYNDGHLLDVLRILGNEDLRKFVEEENYHSLFRYLEDKGLTLEDERKVFLEKNLHSLFRLLGDEYEELRKAVAEDNLHSLFRLLGDSKEDLRKAVVEENLHGLFRVLGPHYEDLRKAITEKNTHSLFRVLGDEYEELRKAVVAKNPNSIFSYVRGNEDLRKIFVDKNPHSLFRILKDSDTAVDLKKLAFDKNVWSLKRLEPSVKDEIILAMESNKDVLWNLLSKYTDSKFVKPLKYMISNNIDFDMDCLSRGQIKSKKWLIDNLKEYNLELGTVFLCAGWYATLIPMMQEANIEFDKIRSFDIDPNAWKIAELVNRDLALDDWKFKASTGDILDIDYNTHYYTVQKGEDVKSHMSDSPDTIINTSCEHIPNFAEWYAKIPSGKLVILQSNDYFDIDEHVNCSKNIDEFSKSAPMQATLFEGTLDLTTYRRFMKIGYR